MKKIILAVAAVMVSVAAFAQGVVVFNNRVGTEVVARVLLPDGVTGAGAGFTAQLYGGPEGTAASALSPLTPTLTFRTSSAAGAGFTQGGADVVIPGVASGAKAAIVLRAYNGADFASSTIKGESGLITVTVGGGTLPPSNLTGLQGFTMTGTTPPVDPVVPEPSTIALAVIGVGALLLRRK